MEDKDKINYLIKMIDYICDENCKHCQLRERIDNVIYAPEFKKIIDECDPKPKYLVNF
jgi:hypothetical protein